MPTCFLVVVLMLLPGIAFASSPDPSWIAGIYDGGDCDDIVTLVYETTAASTGAHSDLAPHAWLPGVWLESVARGLPGDRLVGVSRSPPSICHGVFVSSGLCHITLLLRQSRK